MLHQLEGIITENDIADISKTEDLIFDRSRILVLKAMRSIDVQACPGSGKTTLIAAKLILLAKRWPFRHQGVCVLSHTNVAKDEIIDRLRQSSTIEAQRLLSYPHFIGTIQEFVNRFLALPSIRKPGVNVRFVEGDKGWKEVLQSGEDLNLLYSSLYHKCGGKGKPWPKNDEIYESIIHQLGSLFWLNSSLDLAFYGDFGSLVDYSNDPTKKVYPKLQSLKRALEGNGIYQYRDMFVFAQMLLMQNDEVRKAISSRFPCVFLDEMQDTQKFQDDLLREIFPLTDSSHIVQRFGDPDQAIFHGIGNEEPNESFNGKSRNEMDFVIHKSHRFDSVLADKVKSFSLKEIPLETEFSAKDISNRFEVHAKGGSFEHTIILFNNETLIDVVKFFAQLVSHQFADYYKKSRDFSMKVVGAVGNEIDPKKEQLKLGHYWPSYDKTKAKTKFEEDSLLETVRYCRQSSSIDWAEKYKLLIDCILKLMRIAGKRDENERYFSSSTLRDSLKDEKKWNRLQKIIFWFLNDTSEIEQHRWDKIGISLTELLGLNTTVEAKKYLAFGSSRLDTTGKEQDQVDAVLVSLPDNRIRHRDGFVIDLSTIHGVKGETHDATLVVETKNHTFDLESMLPYLIGELPNTEHPNQNLPDKPNWNRAFKPNKVFMRQFYVAMSRPKHLLCLALHSDRISDAHKDLLIEKGWKLEVLASPHSD